MLLQRPFYPPPQRDRSRPSPGPLPRPQPGASPYTANTPSFIIKKNGEVTCLAVCIPRSRAVLTQKGPNARNYHLRRDGRQQKACKL